MFEVVVNSQPGVDKLEAVGKTPKIFLSLVYSGSMSLACTSVMEAEAEDSTCQLLNVILSAELPLMAMCYVRRSFLQDLFALCS